MKTNLLIRTEQLATRILFCAAPIAKTFSENYAKMYHVRCCLSSGLGNYHLVTLWIWGVKTGINHYSGLIFNTGIIADGETEISRAVYATFHEDEILNDDEQSLLKTELCSGITLRIDQDGHQYLEEIKFPDNLSAAEELRRKHPNLLGGAIMIKIGAPKKQISYWVIANSSNEYEGISPFDGAEITIPRRHPVQMVNLGEHAGKGYYLKQKSGKFVLTRKKATYG